MSALTIPKVKQVHFSDLQDDIKGFEALAAELKRIAGINLPTNPKNISLMAGRISPLLNDKNLADYSELLERLQEGDLALTNAFVVSMTTNTTQFFREKSHFAVLSSLLPDILGAKKKMGDRDFRMWCAAASCGQEPYSLLMTISPLILKGGVSLKFLASDIDRDALAKASRGIYSEQEIEGVEPIIRQQFFEKRATHRSINYQIKKSERDLVTFAPFNLIENRYPFKHQFDVIFCRNVLIYFDKETCQKVISNLIEQVKIGGYLFLGHSESGNIRNKNLKVVAHAVYQKC